MISAINSYLIPNYKSNIQQVAGAFSLNMEEAFIDELYNTLQYPTIPYNTLLYPSVPYNALK